MNSDPIMKETERTDNLLRKSLQETRRIPAENPWLTRRIMAALPEEKKKHRKAAVLQHIWGIAAILIILFGWVAGGLWFLNSETTLSSIAVLCSIPLVTLFSGAVVAAPAIRRMLS